MCYRCRLRGRRNGGCAVRLRRVLRLRKQPARSYAWAFRLLTRYLYRGQPYRTISRRLTSRNNARSTSDASNPPRLLPIDFQVHARGRCIITTRVGAPKEVRFSRSCTKFRRRHVVSSQPDELRSSRSPQSCDKILLALRRQEIKELTESCPPHEAVFAKLDGWAGDCPGRIYIID
jgi:hypothetical protein